MDADLNRVANSPLQLMYTRTNKQISFLRNDRASSTFAVVQVTLLLVCSCLFVSCLFAIVGSFSLAFCFAKLFSRVDIVSTVRFDVANNTTTTKRPIGFTDYLLLVALWCSVLCSCVLLCDFLVSFLVAMASLSRAQNLSMLAIVASSTVCTTI
jgi:hypothetical protein